MDLFANVTPFSTSLAVVAGLIVLAAALAVEVPGLFDKPKLIKPTLYTYACGLLVLALIAGWLAIRLNVSECRAIPDATIDSVIKQLDTQAAEAQK